MVYLFDRFPVTEGCIFFERITKERFDDMFEEAEKEGTLRSYVSSAKTEQALKKNMRHGFFENIPEPKTGDVVLIAQYEFLTEPDGDPNGYQFFAGFYTERPPVPKWRDLITMDIYDPETIAYFQRLYHLTGNDGWQQVEAVLKEFRSLKSRELEERERLHGLYVDYLRIAFDMDGLLQTMKFK